jgi:hypothetical protein
MKVLSEREQLAWCAGFLDGEGNFASHPRGRIVIQAAQTTREELDRLAATLGGNVCGPYANTSGLGRRPYYTWSITNRPGFEAALERLSEFLSPKKLSQATAALARFHEMRAERLAEKGKTA